MYVYIGAIGHVIWGSSNHIKDIWYLHYKLNPGGDFFIIFFYFMLLHATFIPVSLYVSMSVTRYAQVCIICVYIICVYIISTPYIYTINVYNM